jgi:tetratricopeptide (TPR) repeat protein
VWRWWIRSRCCARRLLGQGRVDEALECSIRSEELGFEDDYLNEAAWRLARGSVLSARGDHEAAIPLLRRAVEIADGTDMTDLRGDVRLALARTLHAAGQSEASRVAAEALGLYELKGNEVRAAEARAFMAMAEAVSAG